MGWWMQFESHCWSRDMSALNTALMWNCLRCYGVGLEWKNQNIRTVGFWNEVLQNQGLLIAQRFPVFTPISILLGPVLRQGRGVPCPLPRVCAGAWGALACASTLQRHSLWTGRWFSLCGFKIDSPRPSVWHPSRLLMLTLEQQDYFEVWWQCGSLGPALELAFVGLQGAENLPFCWVYRWHCRSWPREHTWEVLLQILNPFCFKLHLTENMKLLGAVILRNAF